MNRKSFKALLLGLLFAVLMSVSVSAATPEAAIGSKKYSTLQQAVSAVKSGQTIKVLKDLTLSTTVKSQNSVKYTLDFNNHTVKGVKKTFNRTNDISKITGVLRFTRGNVTIKNGKFSGYGTIKVEKGAQLTISSGSYWQLVNAGKVSVSNSRFSNGGYPAILNQYTLILNKVSISSTKNHIVSKAGKVTINNGNFRNNGKESSSPMILLDKTNLVISGGTYTNNNYYIVQANSGTVKITSGSFHGNKKEILYNAGGKFTITGGSFSSFYRTVLNQKGSMAISGGKFSCKATVCFENHGTASIIGSTFDGQEGISVSNHGILTINSGVFKSSCLWGSAIVCEEGEITIKNGTFTSTNRFALEVYRAKKLALTGGKFTTHSQYGITPIYLNNCTNTQKTISSELKKLITED